MLRKGFKTTAGSLCLLSSILLVSFLYSAEQGLTVEDVLDRYRQHYEESIEDIDDYVLETDTYTAYYRKTYLEDRPYFESRIDFEEYDVSTVSGVSDDKLFSPKMYNNLIRTATYEGMEELNGYRVHVVYTDQVEGLLPEEEETGIKFNNARFYIDSEEWIMRKMEFEIETEIEDEIRTLSPTVHMQDYRNLQGKMIPFRTTMIVEGIGGQMTDEERQEALQAMEEMEHHMQGMSPEEREMMRRMAGARIEQYRKMIESDRLESIHEVKSVRVNEGLPEGLFEE